MNFRLLKAIFLVVIGCASADSFFYEETVDKDDDGHLLINGTKYMCGNTNAQGKGNVETFGNYHLCLLLPDPKDPEKWKKVGFHPVLERMDSLEIRGLFDIYKDFENVQVRALSQGVVSRPTYLKKENATTELLNLVVEMKDGSVTSLDWKN